MKISSSKKQVFFLYLSSLIGLFLSVIVSVINTRFLSPVEYGDVRYVQNYINLISSFLLVGFFTSGSRLLAINELVNIRRSIRGVMFIILLITIAILVVLLLSLGCYYKLIGNINLYRLFLVAVPVCGNVLMLNYINTTAQGDNQIGRISLARLTPAFFYCIIALPIFVYFHATSCLMLFLYNGVSVLILMIIIFSTRPSFKNLKSTFFDLKAENKLYGFNVYIGSLIAVSTQYVAGVTLGAFCDDNANVGFYTLALSLSTPLAMLPGIIGTTQYRKFAKADRIDNRIIFISAVITVLSLLFFLTFIKYVVGLLYDDNYVLVSFYASFLAIGTCFHGFGDMFNRFLGSHGFGKEIRNGAIFSGITSIMGYFILVYFVGIIGAIITRIISSIVYFLSMLYYYYRFVNHSIKNT